MLSFTPASQQDNWNRAHIAAFLSSLLSDRDTNISEMSVYLPSMTDVLNDLYVFDTVAMVWSALGRCLHSQYIVYVGFDTASLASFDMNTARLASGSLLF